MTDKDEKANESPEDPGFQFGGGSHPPGTPGAGPSEGRPGSGGAGGDGEGGPRRSNYTGPDVTDGHEHGITSVHDSNLGHGVTEIAGDPPHAHAVIGWIVEPYFGPAGYISRHEPASVAPGRA